MAKSKVTVTLDPEQLVAIENLVRAGKAQSLSGFVQHAVTVSLADVAGWGATLALALDQTGGELTKKERSWADSVLKGGAKNSRKRKAA